MNGNRLLILGGSQFIGRALVEEIIATRSDLDVTLFNRGQSNPNLFPNLKKIAGDRETSDIDKILTQDWDYIIDVNGYYPNSIEVLLPKLRGKVGRYIYVSTVSVYDVDAYLGKPDALVSVDYPMLACTPEQRLGDWSTFYGEKKAECERVILANEWLDRIILRPSIVYGKYDYTERYYYWLQRVKTREKIIIPHNGNERGNLTFVNDLVALLIGALTLTLHRTTYNAVTHPINTMREKIDVIASVMNKTPELISLSADQLGESGLAKQSDFPCTFGGDMLIYDISKTQKDFSIEFTPYAHSVRQTIEYYDAVTKWEAGKRGLTLETEDTLLKKL